jgi:hypothetical protein
MSAVRRSLCRVMRVHSCRRDTKARGGEHRSERHRHAFDRGRTAGGHFSSNRLALTPANGLTRKADVRAVPAHGKGATELVEGDVGLRLRRREQSGRLRS